MNLTFKLNMTMSVGEDTEKDTGLPRKQPKIKN